ncbi:MAG TPA: hypothetical protein VGJ93_04160 [Desulfuromonadaceae bacterium]
MNHLSCLLLATLMLLVSACSTIPFAPTELTPVQPESAGELIGKLWSSGTGSLLIRQSALFELQGLRVPITGIMKLDLSAKSARLVGMNDMGVKLYDISVDRTSSRANFIMPDLARYPGFAEAVAVSVRRIFLTPEPSAADSLTLTSTSYRLSRESSEGKLGFILGGAETQLLEKTCRGKVASWQVRYYQYQRLQGILLPGGVVLDDDLAGYRLTLWIESVEKGDE